MKAVGYLGSIDCLFGVPATTRNWNTITAIGNVLDKGRSNDQRPAHQTYGVHQTSSRRSSTRADQVQRPNLDESPRQGGGRYPMDEGHIVVDLIVSIRLKDITRDWHANRVSAA